MRDKLSLLVLLFTAMAAVTAAALVFLRGVRPFEFALWGLALAQVQLAASSLVFVGGRLVVRVAILIAVVLFWTFMLAETDKVSVLQSASLVLLSPALLTAGWCGILRFFGERLANVGENNVRRNQFSLATLLIVMTIAGTYLGLWQFANEPYTATEVFMVVICTPPGCALLHTMMATKWRFVPLMFIVVLYCIALPSNPMLDALLEVMFVQCAFLGATLIVLRVAGIRLVRDTKTIELALSYKATDSE